MVEVVEAHDASAEVSKDGLTVSGDSIMGLLMLAASKGSTIEVVTTGPEAEKLADSLEALVADRFGEDV
jgi:phosphocarrier protein